MHHKFRVQMSTAMVLHGVYKPVWNRCTGGVWCSERGSLSSAMSQCCMRCACVGVVQHGHSMHSMQMYSMTGYQSRLVACDVRGSCVGMACRVVC